MTATSTPDAPTPDALTPDTSPPTAAPTRSLAHLRRLVGRVQHPRTARPGDERPVVAADDGEGRLPRVQARRRRVLLPPAVERARQGRVVRRSRAVGDRRDRTAERRSPPDVLVVPRAVVAARARRRDRTPPRVLDARRRLDRRRRPPRPAHRGRRRRSRRGRGHGRLPADLDQRRHAAVGDHGDLHDRGRAHRRLRVLAVADDAERRAPRARVRRGRG